MPEAMALRQACTTSQRPHEERSVGMHGLLSLANTESHNFTAEVLLRQGTGSWDLQEALRLQQSSQAEAERLHADALQFRQQSQQQAEALVARSRQEAATIQEGANRYAEQVLGELEGRLQELAQVVVGGRRELVRLQGVDPTTLIHPSTPVEASAVPISRARRAAERLRRAAGTR